VCTIPSTLRLGWGRVYYTMYSQVTGDQSRLIDFVPMMRLDRAICKAKTALRKGFTGVLVAWLLR